VTVVAKARCDASVGRREPIALAQGVALRQRFRALHLDIETDERDRERKQPRCDE
jgi:hypothetical protein